MHGWQCTWRARQLFLHLFHMVQVNMRITQRVHKVTQLQITHLGHHHREQCIGCNVERYTKENIRTALIKLAAQFTIGDIELKKRMAWRQFHFLDICNVPCGDNQTA